MRLNWSDLALAALMTLPLAAAPVLVDNFDDAQLVSVGPAGVNPLANSGGVLTGANSIGGARTVTVTRTAGNSFDFVLVSNGIFEFNLAAADAGSALIIWDGDTNPILNENGFGPVDMTDSGTNTHFVAMVRSDLVAPITFTIYSGTGNSSSFTINTPAAGFVVPFAQYYIPFAAFVNTGGTGGDFSGVTALTALLDGTNQPGTDFQLDLIGGDRVPEPGTFGLAGLLLGGLVYIARRR